MKKDVLFGICADVHQGWENVDYSAGVKKFVDEANERKADFIIQLGDFSAYGDYTKLALDEWRKFNGPAYHVLGNHDSENCGKETVMRILGMDKKYYSFDAGDYHFIVLDTNYMKMGNRYIDYHSEEYEKHRAEFFSCHVSAEQLEWLKADIDATDKRCFVFTHAALAVGDWTVQNLHDLQGIFWMANEKAGYNKVTMCFSGHDHADAYLYKGDVHYMLINSMNFKFIGFNCFDAANRKQLEEDYGRVWHTVDYKDPLYAFVRLKENGLIQIIGKQSEYLGHSPKEVNWEYYASPQIAYREVWMSGNRKI